MAFIDNQLKMFKQLIENSIVTSGLEGKTSIIRSSHLINLIHDAVKYELINARVFADNIYPRFGNSSPEIKIAGFLKQKDQDICVVPSNILKAGIDIDWGPLKFLNKRDEYGFDYSNNMLVINVRSQMSSLAKNADTLFERTFAEALNLHMRYRNMVLGEVYLIPVYEYDDSVIKNKEVGFKAHSTNLERYISFFDSINNRPEGGEEYMYERCALLIVDFNRKIPKLYRNSQELKEAQLISPDFHIEYANLSFDTFAEDILTIYRQRFDISNIMDDIKF